MRALGHRTSRTSERQQLSRGTSYPWKSIPFNRISSLAYVLSIERHPIPPQSICFAHTNMIYAARPIEMETPLFSVTGTRERITAMQASGTLFMDSTNEYVVALVVDRNHSDEKDIANAQRIERLAARTSRGLPETLSNVLPASSARERASSTNRGIEREQVVGERTCGASNWKARKYATTVRRAHAFHAAMNRGVAHVLMQKCASVADYASRKGFGGHMAFERQKARRRRTQPQKNEALCLTTFS